MWKRLLKKSDKDLNIDPEFTRPGVEKFLENFADKVADEDEKISVEFEWF